MWRWFKKTYGITFHGFQRMYRIDNAYKELKDGKSATATAFDLGYQSLSGFGYTYKKIIANAPSNSSSRKIILINRLTTPLGPMIVCSTDLGICLLEFMDRKMLETEFKDLQKKLKAEILIGENLHTKQLKKEIKEYFARSRKTFRAVARANGANRISIAIPCHRIISKNGDLTGYGGGIDRKRWLLEFEKSTILADDKKI